MHRDYGKSVISIVCIIGILLLGCSGNKGKIIWKDNEKSEKSMSELQGYSLLTDIPNWSVQGGCYIEDGLFITAYGSQQMDRTILRCYDSINDTVKWQNEIDGCGMSGTIAFRPKDRKLYVANVYDETCNLTNKISVIDYDHIDDGVIDVITSPARGGLTGVGYDIENDVFYSTNYMGVNDGEANVLFVYEGLFDSVKQEIVLDDFTVRYDKHLSNQGINCIVEDIAYIVYHSHDNSLFVVAGYDIVDGSLVQAYEIPGKIGVYDVIEPEALLYLTDENRFVLQDAYGLIDCVNIISGERNANIDKTNIPECQCRYISLFPQIWALCGCYAEEDVFIVGYVATDGSRFVIRGYNCKNEEWIWLKEYENIGYVNSICFRSKDRKLYLSNSYTYAESSDDLESTILVLDYDNLDAGVIDIIQSPARGGIYSIAYDKDMDTFYSTNYIDNEEGEANILFSYNDVFDSVRDETVLGDLAVRSDSHFSQLGVNCVHDGTAWITYYNPEKVIASYDITTGLFKSAYKLPEKTEDGVTIGEIEKLIYNSDEDIYILQTASNFVRCPFLE